MTDWLDWPFLEDRHRALYGRLVEWCGANIADAQHGDDIDAECRSLVSALGQAGFLKLCVAEDGKLPDVRPCHDEAGSPSGMEHGDR